MNPTQLQEQKNLLELYQYRAAKALNRHFPVSTMLEWIMFLDEIKNDPASENRLGLELVSERFGNMTEWAALTRYLWLCGQIRESMDAVYGKRVAA
jgi:hypothetical protein